MSVMAQEPAGAAPTGRRRTLSLFPVAPIGHGPNNPVAPEYFDFSMFSA